MANGVSPALLHCARRIGAEQLGCRVLSDRELLARFADEGNELAFETLVQRHGAMVQSACRRVLGTLPDADDVFQATFLVLAQKAAGAWHDSIAGWLYTTAVQLARKARTAALRRARHEAKVPPRDTSSPLAEISAAELLRSLDEELLKLPAHYRDPLVLCYLRGATRDEAASELGCTPATIKSRLERGRRRLHDALAARGMTLPAVLAVSLAAAPMACAAQAVVQAAVSIQRGESLASVVSAPVARLTLGGVNAVLWTRTFLVLCALLVASGLALWAGADTNKSATTPQQTNKTAPADTKTAANKTVPWAGLVLRPDGKPAAGASVFFVRTAREDGETRTAMESQVVAGPDGRFVLQVPAALPKSPTTLLMAVAKGFGPGWARLDPAKPDVSTTLQLVNDDVPIEGRVLDLEGQPLKGVTVRVLATAANQVENLGPWLERLSKTKEYHASGAPYAHFDVQAAGLSQTVQTNAAGKFQVSGFGRERLVTLRFDGPTIESSLIQVVTRRNAPALTVPLQRGDPWFGSRTIRPAKFDYAAAPTRVVEGVVRDADTGKAIAGLIVQASLRASAAYSRDNMLQTTTDKEGRYRLVGLPLAAGQVIQITPPMTRGYLPAGQATPKIEGDQSVTLNFDLRQGIVIRGKVTDKETGKPVQAEVQYFAFNDNPSLKKFKGFTRASIRDQRTNPDGTFTLLGMPGPGIVAAHVDREDAPVYLTGVGAENIPGRDKSGHYFTWPYYLTPSRHHTLQAIAPKVGTRELTCDLVLDPGKTITGTFVDPDGKLVDDVYISGSWGLRSHRFAWNKDGKFRIPGVNPNRPLPVFCVQKKRHLAAVVQFKGEKTDGVTVVLQPMGVITGRLLDQQGQPLANEVINGNIEDGQLQLDHGWYGFYHAATDKDGRFRAQVIPGVRVGGAHTLYQGRQIGEQLYRGLTLKAGEVKDVGDFKVNPKDE